RAMLLMVSGAVPVFESVTVWGALVVLSCLVSRRADVGVSVAADAVPVPERLAVCGLPLASSVTVKVAVRAAVAVGVNVTLMVQQIGGASGRGRRGRLVVWRESTGVVPSRARLLRGIGWVA